MGNAACARRFPKQTTKTSTVIILVGLLLTYLALPSDNLGNVFAGAALGIGLSLAIATVIDGAAGVRAIIRVDIVMLWVLYGLTFLEFLFPQPAAENLLSSDLATKGVLAAMLGFAGIAIGRHLVPRRRKANPAFFADVAPRNIFLLFVMAASLGYFHILLSVDFDVFEMFRQMTLPRFSQSWTRGRYGDASALLAEIGALLYLVPPVAGLIYARAKEFGILQKFVVTVVLLATLYYAFSSGTRSILAVYVITFFGAYYLTKPKINLWQAAAQGTVALIILLLVTSYMLVFREAGVSSFSFADRPPGSLYIDNNMVVLAQITGAFPAVHDFLGFEIPYSALVHPIPRALWPEKPEVLSVTIESIVGVVQSTIACTFIGEAYMMGGMLGVGLVAMFFGAAAEMWNRLRQDQNSAFSQVLYTSGFFCAAISMRSMLWTTVTMLPTMALWFYGRLWLRRATPARTSSSPKPH